MMKVVARREVDTVAARSVHGSLPRASFLGCYVGSPPARPPAQRTEQPRGRINTPRPGARRR
jgi:hypothetical protein